VIPVVRGEGLHKIGWGSSLYSLYALLSWMLRTNPSVSLIVNFNWPATDTLDDGSARVRARANSSVKAGGVSISAQSAPQSATIPNSTPQAAIQPSWRSAGRQDAADRQYNLLSQKAGASWSCTIGG
jgi:hypothetical protein